MTTYALSLARAVDPAILAAIPRQPHPDPIRSRNGQGEMQSVTDAVAEYRAIKEPKWGDMTKVAAKHGTTISAMVTRMKREDARRAKL